jgi:hypothetical protein
MHILRLGDARKRQLEGLNVLHDGLQHWLKFFTYGATVTEDKMSQLVENNPVVMAAYEELRRFTSNSEMRDLERRRQQFLEDQYIQAYSIANAIANADTDPATAEATKKVVEDILTARRNLEIAQAMERKGFDIETIAELTGITFQEIEHLD